MKSKKTNKLHRELCRYVIKTATLSSSNKPLKQGSTYLGTKKPFHPIAAKTARIGIKNWIKGHSALTQDQYNSLLKSLSMGKTSNEFSYIGDLLQLLPKLRKNLKPTMIGDWLKQAQGWAEVDSICQSKFSGEDLLAKWKLWQKTLISLSARSNVHQRRASLVLLTKPVRDPIGSDIRLMKLAFRNIEQLQNEKDILITKAISWLLRDLIKHHRDQVELYLNSNESNLPRIAVRETRNKLRSGRKSGR